MSSPPIVVTTATTLADAQRVMEQRHVRQLPVMQCPAFAYRSARDVGTSHDEPALLMKFDDQKWQPGIEALAGSIRLKARLLISYYRI